jgi:hypothetical protein
MSAAKEPVGHGKGPFPSGGFAHLEAAIADAWEDAKAKGEEAGEYKVEIHIHASNPIHTYSVTIIPV